MASRQILWNVEKDRLLRLAECATAIEEGRILDDIKNASRPNQRVFILEINNYVFAVPYVFDAETVFLKTMFPSRKLTARYKGKNDDRKN